MRIAHLTRQFYPAWGGIETVVQQLSRQLLSMGHCVDIITLDRLFEGAGNCLPAQEIMDGIRVTRIPYQGPRRYAIAPSALKEIRGCDVVHLHSSDFFLDYLALTKPWHRVPLVLSSHGLFFHTTFARTFKRLYFYTQTRLALRRVSEIICDSPQDLALLRSVAPITKLHVIPNGIDYERLASFDTSNRDPDLIISVGRIASNKRVDRMLQAFAHLVTRHPTARLVIMGPDWGRLSSARELCTKLNITEQVEFMGRVSELVLSDLLGRANLWLSSSSYESFGVALLEAMAAGCVPVVQPLPAFTQLLTDGVEGLYADFECPSHASNVILRALTFSHQERMQMMERARAKAAQFSWSTIAQQFERVYMKAIEG
jgi:alpha-1,3-mannosyltransferase